MKQIYWDLIFHEMKKQGKDICFRCNKPIIDINTLSIEHMINHASDIKNQKDLFLNPSNLSFSHEKCNQSAGGKAARKSDGYTGVETINAEKGLYRAKFSYKGKQLKISGFNNEIEAGEFYDLSNMKYHDKEHDLNFPDKSDQYKAKIAGGWKSEIIERAVKLINGGARFFMPAQGFGVSKYKGVDQFDGRWRVSIMIDKGEKLSQFTETEQEAAELYDIFCLHHRDGKGGLNLPEKAERYYKIIGTQLNKNTECHTCRYKYLGFGQCQECYHKMYDNRGNLRILDLQTSQELSILI